MIEDKVLQFWSPANIRQEGPYTVKINVEKSVPASYFFFDMLRGFGRDYYSNVYRNSRLENGSLEFDLSLRELGQFFLGFHPSQEVSKFLMNFVDEEDGVSEQIVKGVISELDNRFVYAYVETGANKSRVKHAHRLITKSENYPLLMKRLTKKHQSSITPSNYNWNWKRWTAFMGDPIGYSASPLLKHYINEELLQTLWGSEMDDKKIVISLDKTLVSDFRISTLPDELVYPNILDEKNMAYLKSLCEEKPNVVQNLWVGDRRIWEIPVFAEIKKDAFKRSSTLLEQEQKIRIL